MIETAIAWTLAEDAGYSRQAPRAPHQRPPDYGDLFDALTVFYDCFRVSPVEVMLIGPPLLNFAGILDSLKIFTVPGGAECSYTVEHLVTTGFANRQTHNICRLIVQAPAAVSALRVQCAAGSATLAVLAGSADRFKGKRVLLTLSRDNDPAWICDWMRYHRDLHQANAVLLYDNGSTAYDADALAKEMRQVAGFDVVTVIDWPYKYGPQGIGRGTWDSAFCQDGALEDARWRFLGEASGVLSCDIDECVLSTAGSVFDAVAASAEGCVKFSGAWAYPPAAGSPHQLSRHQESTLRLLPRWRFRGLRLKNVHACPAKWAVVPGRCPGGAHWSVHEVVGMQGRTLRPSHTAYRHFRKINTNWKKGRTGVDSKPPGALQEDRALKQAFSEVHWDR